MERNSKKVSSVHLIHWRLQRIGVMRTKVTASSPSSSTVVSREASNLLKTRINYLRVTGIGLRVPASWWLGFVFPPHNCDVEVDPEEDVDDEDGNEGFCNIGYHSLSFQLQPGIPCQHQANA